MFSNTFYHRTLRKIVAGFGTIFNDINVVRTDTNGIEVGRIKIPLSYGPRDKYLIRQVDEPELQRPIDVVLPRMSFQITSLQYDPQRKLNTIGRTHRDLPVDNQRRSRMFNPVPYNIGFDLSIMTKTIDDGNQIVEQILPFFTPDYTITIDAIPEMELRDDIPIVLNSINLEDNFDDDWKSRRNIIWTLAFTAKAYIYGPIKSDPVITKAQEDYLVPSGDLEDPAVLARTPRSVRYSVEIDPPTAFATDDFGYTETITDYTDNKKFNPVTGNDEDIP